MSACKDEAPTSNESTASAPSIADPIITQYYALCEASNSTGCVQKIPAGRFLMGAQSSDPDSPGFDPHAAENEGPPRWVEVSAFAINKDPISARLYKICIENGGCVTDDVRSGKGTWNIGRKKRWSHPINGVTWDGAQRFCKFVGGRLPTEAEWEYAARGTDGRKFPWGNEAGCGRPSLKTGPFLRTSDQTTETSCENKGTTSATDTRPSEESAYKINSMAGNVWEWVADWYADDAYSNGKTKNPRGPDNGTERVQRGGGWANTDPMDLRSAGRGSMPPDMKMDDVGFRCAWDMKEVRE